MTQIPYTPENVEKVKAAADGLTGTCNSVDDALAVAFSDHELTTGDFDIELLRELDAITMCCEACGWWCETHELDEDQVCGDCR